uniref:Uncharacterized protein n=1 Tax=Arundo donax TaxID=35708 RepID=A0A0A8YN83_ARUDO
MNSCYKNRSMYFNLFRIQP